MALDTDVIVVGGGLAGLVATAEIADAGRRVILLDQEPEASLGGQAFWSFGGLMFVDSPEQRRLRVKDSYELALDDWLGSAAFDRPEDHWPRKWAEAYVGFATHEKRAWLHEQGVRWFPFVQWPERGGYAGRAHGNSVPRFHITWGTGPGIIAPFIRRVREHEQAGRVELRFRHRATGLRANGGAIDGVTGEVLARDAAIRGAKSNRDVAGGFELGAQAVVVTSGGIGGNHELCRRNWPERAGKLPDHMLSGVPDHVDGLMIDVTQDAGGHVIGADRMWHYPEGIKNYDPIWSHHGIRILPGPSSIWLDADGKRLPPPLFPGFDALGSVEHITRNGHSHSWFVLNQRIIEREFALSGSEQNPDLTDKDWKLLLGRVKPGAPAPVQAFVDKGEDFVTATNVRDLVAKMNELTGGEPPLDATAIEDQIVTRDRQVETGLGKDPQVTATAAARHFLTDKLVRVAKPHRILDPAAGPLIAVRLHILTRKTLGGLETDLDGRVLAQGGEPLAGVYAAGEAAGFGGGGVHGYRALEGTFLGGCLFSGRTAGRAVGAAVA
jgi:predicted oxidoreductase